MNCRRFEIELADWTAGRLPIDMAKTMEAHTVSCRSCAALAEQERTLRAACRSLPPISNVPDLWPQLAARIADQQAPAAARPWWQAWIPELGPSVRYGLAGVAAAVLFTMVAVNRPGVGPAPNNHQAVVGTKPAQPAGGDVIELVADRQAMLPEADGDLAIVHTSRHRAAERVVLGLGAAP